MTTGILVGLTIVLILAAAGVGMLLLRRRRPQSVEPVASEEPQTVGDLVRLRTTPADDRAGHQLFTPSAPRTGSSGIPVVARPSDGSRPAPAGAEARTAQVPLPPQAPPTGEAGDAPWRRAARMMGVEPGAGWDTAPLPVVPAENAPEPARRPDARRIVEVPLADAPAPAAVESIPATASVPEPTAAKPVTGSPAAESPVGESSAAQSSVKPPAAEPVAEEPPAVTPVEPATVRPAEPTPAESTPTGAEPVTTEPAARPAFAERVTEPVALPVAATPAALSAPAAPPAQRPRPTPMRRPAATPGGRTADGASAWILPEAVGATTEKPTTPMNRAELDGPGLNGSTAAPAREPAGSDGPSRPLSDPDLTPLMGIPIVRPFAADEPVPPPAVAESRATPPVPPTNRVLVDDEVVSMSPGTGVRPAPVVRTGSPQPVWFRVVRRDGEPVAGAVVALLDDHGQEVDATKTATDGGGELHSPHGGRFLMVTSAEGFQPRAVLLTVDGQPVELALLLPRSAAVSGAVRSGTRVVTGARVVARQEGEIVDDLVTGRDGSYRFDDLAEGSYVLSATDHRGDVVQQVRLSEGADVAFDLELVYREGAR